MARDNTNLDEFFKEKLIQDSIKPSKLAWDRLESQLPKQEKTKTPFMWWAVAAAVAIMFSVSYLTLRDEVTEQNPILLAEENQESQEIPEQNSTESILESTFENQNEEVPTSEENAISEPLKVEKKKTVEKSNSNPPQKLMAQAEVISEPSSKVELDGKELIVEPVEVPALKLPDLQVNKTVAVVEETPMEKEPTYRVKIYSDGLEEEKDKNLIAGIGKKVEQVEGLFGKVDQGFADLQDAKNNLFTSLLTKKEKIAEKL
ncbi:MAG: hypothetical protein P8O16_03425 [Algoriphagus sp.]|uniref:hypothetical protein n=1 Tax=Algoriphagus sp. TaxID=1872435 RepID=UPI002608C29D|nr:hypothetical protein [Algoriphagus sp.]MDG1276305.1 hypothetical protein [Algoriphagus sp.]